MNKQQRQELLEFLNKQSPSDTLLDCSFRLLCFMYDDRVLKDWIHTEQAPGAPLFEATLLIPSINKKWSFKQTVKEVLESLDET